MAVSRRMMLVVGGAAVVVAGAGWAMTRAPRSAREPWRRAGESFGDPRLDALAYAILAPNPHNMQPWRVRLDGEDSLTVYCDPGRLLPETDPLNRQITIGFGCFLELLALAAQANGWRAAIDPFPEGEPQPRLDARPIARVRFSPETATVRDELFAAAFDRRTNRKPFSDTPVDPDALRAVLGEGADGVALDGAVDGAIVAELRALTVDAWNVEWATAHTRRESIDVTRIGKTAINDDPWGLALSGPAIDALAAVGGLTREGMDRPGSTAYRQSLEFYARACRTARGFVWATTKGNSRRDQIETGRVWMRTHLAATRTGLAFHPLSQALQEFPEMAALYARAHELLAPGGGVVQMLVRIGHASAPPPAPREPLRAKLVPA